MDGFDYSVPLVVTHVRGTRIMVTLDIVSNVLYVPRVEHPDYLGCDCLKMITAIVIRMLYPGDTEDIVDNLRGDNNAHTSNASNEKRY